MKRFFIALDLLRGMAAVMVLLVHVRGGSFVEFGALPPDQRTLAVAAFFGVTRLGEEAVMVFFVLSGFLVGGQIIERARNGTFDLQHYAIDRCTRIYLPLVPACVLTVFISLAVFGETTRPLTFLGNALGLNGILVPTLDANPPLWSLAYEIWFYIVGGATAYLALQARSHFAVAVLAMSALSFSRLAASFLLYWAFGAIMVLFTETTRKGAMAIVGLSLIVSGTILHELAFASKSFENIAFLPIEVARGMLCVGVALSLPLLCSEPIQKALYPFRRLAQSFAAGSYTLYLTHFPVAVSLNSILPKASSLSLEGWTYFMLRIAICLLAAMVMYVCFEKHTSTVRKWLSLKTSQSPRSRMQP